MRAVIRWIRSTLRPGVTLLNLSIYLLAAFLSIFLFVYVNAAQALVLTDVVRVTVSQLGNATGSLALYDEIVSLVALLLWGFASDFVGRRSVYALGFLIIGIATVSIPFAFNLYPDLLLTRLTFAIGAAAAACMLTAVLADFVRDEQRGLIAGVVGLVSGLGALLALFVFLPLPLRFESRGFSALAAIRLTYHIVAIISFTFAVFLWFMIRPSPVNTSDDAEREDDGDKAEQAQKEGEVEQASENATNTVQANESKKSLMQIAKEGLLAGKNAQVALGYVGGFVARADNIVLTLFITLYVNARFLRSGECGSFDVNAPTDVVRDLCNSAYQRGSVLSGIAQTCALIGALLYGVLADRISRSLTLALAIAVGFIGFTLLAAIDDPKSGLAILAVCLMGFGQIGAVVVSLAMVTTSDIPADVRGSVAGVYGFIGALGIMLCGRLGGALFDSWREIAPFVLMAVIHGVAILLSLGVWFLECTRSISESTDEESSVQNPNEEE